jgi:uncharacterized protein (DUF2147 family)
MIPGERLRNEEVETTKGSISQTMDERSPPHRRLIQSKEEKKAGAQRELGMIAALRNRRREEGNDSQRIYERDKTARGRKVVFIPDCGKVLAKPGLKRMVNPVRIGAYLDN